MRRQTRASVGQGEAIAVWALWAVVLAAVVATYARLDPAELYNTSVTGLPGGLGRALVLVNFPVALVAVALALIAVDALPRLAWAAFAVVAVGAAFVPFVVDDDDLDARWVNAVPAVGVVVALGLTVAAARRAGPGFADRGPGDIVRAVLLAVIALVSLPWLSADLGFHFPGDVFLGEEVSSDDGRLLAAVHLGHHHGVDGSLLAASAILLSRVRPIGASVAVVLRGYLALMLAYGLVNMTQDSWHEQVVKRGWTTRGIPSALYPAPEPIWGVVLLLAVLAFVALSAVARREATMHPA